MKLVGRITQHGPTRERRFHGLLRIRVLLFMFLATSFTLVCTALARTNAPTFIVRSGSYPLSRGVAELQRPNQHRWVPPSQRCLLFLLSMSLSDARSGELI
ncbi:hypothetical protein B0H12DRAFT_1158327 [Mycena haematopus]|nr:hypothetical protein B0H12DRAFT_1158327 [Mycena haematopus]